MEWLMLLGIVVLIAWGMISLQASLMASSRTEQYQEEQAMNAALDTAIAYQPDRTVDSLAEQIAQLELRIRALEGKVG